MSTVYVTTPIYYVNDLPHIGHIYTTIVADTVARYHRLRGDDVRFLTGTDEHGQKIERAAQSEGIPPIELADRVVSRYLDLWKELEVSNDDFIRTTEARHQRSVEEMISRLQESGDLYVGRHEGWYCVSCETFYTEKELLAGNLCPDHGIEAEWRSEENVFFRLSRFQQPLLDWIDSNPNAIQPLTRRNEVRAFIESGLRDLSVSRASLEWGIPFPGHQGQTVYVWLDALTNYLSALGFGSEDASLYERFWKGSETRLHLVGKDILRFHSIFWPAFLMSAGLPLPTTIWAHGWWLRDDRKMSKSVGNIVRPDHLIQTFGPDPLRYFLLREMVFGQDASFSDEAFVDRFNSDLANDLGNTVSRLVTLSRKAFDGLTPPGGTAPGPLAAIAERTIRDYHAEMGELAFHKALTALWAMLGEINQFLVANEPWKMIGKPEKRGELGSVLRDGLEAVRVVAIALLPMMPELAPKILRALGAPDVPTDFSRLDWGGVSESASLPALEPLFPRIDKEAFLKGTAESRATLAQRAASASKATAERSAAAASPPSDSDSQEDTNVISIDKFFETELKVGTVTAAESIPKSNKLLHLTVDLGEPEARSLVAGIAKEYAPEELVGRQVVVVANLEPATLMGVESQGMVLAASVDGKPVLLQPVAPVPSGTKVR